MKTDARLQHGVSEELTSDPSVRAAQIGVEVGRYAEKRNGERSAQRVLGARALAIALEVELTGLGRRSDADIARSADNILAWMASLERGSVKVLVEDGWITLAGEVDWHYQRQAAVDSIRNLLGVSGVSDQIAIKRHVSPAALKSDSEAALHRVVDN